MTVAGMNQREESQLVYINIIAELVTFFHWHYFTYTPVHRNEKYNLKSG